MDTFDTIISFNSDGLCAYCDNFYNNMLPEQKNDKSKECLLKEINKIKKEGVGKDFDCIIGVSGGLDSSYLAYIAKFKFGHTFIVSC